jgi:hypothetical protein
MKSFADIERPKSENAILTHLLLVDGLMPLQRFPDSALQIDVATVVDNSRSKSESPGIQRTHCGIEQQWADNHDNQQQPAQQRSHESSLTPSGIHA